MQPVRWYHAACPLRGTMELAKQSWHEARGMHTNTCAPGENLLPCFGYWAALF